MAEKTLKDRLLDILLDKGIIDEAKLKNMTDIQKRKGGRCRPFLDLSTWIFTFMFV